MEPRLGSEKGRNATPPEFLISPDAHRGFPRAFTQPGAALLALTCDSGAQSPQGCGSAAEQGQPCPGTGDISPEPGEGGQCPSAAPCSAAALHGEGHKAGTSVTLLCPERP